MKVSLKWLSDYVEVPSDIKAFCDKLDLTGTGVEGVDKLGAAFDGVVVGYVETCEDHPDSDHMHVVKVNVGGDEPIQIVCGSPEHCRRHQSARRDDWRGASRRFQNQEVEASRRDLYGHVLLEARIGHGHRP